MIHFTSKKQRNLISIDEAFARLSKISNKGDLTFEFQYVVKLREAINMGATIVRTTISDTYINDVSNTASTTTLGGRSNEMFIKNIVTAAGSIKSLQKAREKAVICRNDIDLTAYVDNRDPKMAIAVSKQIVRSVPINVIQKTNDERPIMVQLTHESVNDYLSAVTSSIALDRKQTMLKMIDDGIDPSIITSMTHRSVTAHDVVSGLLRRKRVDFSNNELPTLLLNSIVVNDSRTSGQVTTNSANVRDESVQILDTVTNDATSIDTSVYIPASRLKVQNSTIKLNELFIEIELIDVKTGLSIESIHRTINVGKYVQAVRVPKRAPNVSISYNTAKNPTLEISSNDPSTAFYYVYKKRILPGSEYVYIATVKAENGRSSLAVSQPAGVSDAYRVIAIGSNHSRSSDFTNVIIAPRNRTLALSTPICATSLSEGVRIELFNVPHDVVGIMIKSRKITSSMSKEKIVGDITHIDATTRQQGIITIIDPNVTNEQTYQYIAYAIDENGLQRKLSTTSIRHIKREPGRVETKITNLNVTYTLPINVTFDITTTINDTTLDIIKERLAQNNVLRYFDNDIEKQRELLKNLIVHGIQRVNLHTGQREDFGQLLSNTFSDFELRTQKGIQEPEIGKQYRYEVYVMLRSPETVLTNILKNVVDPITKKPYTFSPSKFFHPVALTQGLLATKNGLQSRIGLDEMSFGLIGMTADINVNVGSINYNLSDASVEKFDPKTLLIKWRGEGSPKFIDHFIVVKEVNGVRTIVGKAHGINSSYTNMYVPITPRDTGEIRYLIVPISNDYETLTSRYTNSLIIGDV